MVIATAMIGKFIGKVTAIAPGNRPRPKNKKAAILGVSFRARAKLVAPLESQCNRLSSRSIRLRIGSYGMSGREGSQIKGFFRHSSCEQQPGRHAGTRRAIVFPKSSNAQHRIIATSGLARSEEHTSELQSQSNLVCRLLLEK